MKAKNGILLNHKMIDLLLFAQINSAVHKKCLNAKDYLGCVEIMSGTSEVKKQSKKKNRAAEILIQSLKTKNDIGEDCSDSYEMCIAKRGKDILDMPKLIGWLYTESPENRSVVYENLVPYKVKVRGSYGRYIHLESVVRSYQKPKAAKPGYVSGGGIVNTDCYSIGGSITCSSTSAPLVINEGTPAKPGGNIQSKFDEIIDCQDRTYESIFNGKGSKWKPLSVGSTLDSKSKLYCRGDILNYRESSITKYSKEKR